jgi:molybdate transport system regulatory protein
MKISARNQFLGNVVRIRHGAVNDEIELGLSSGKTIIATISHESTEDLGLQPGSQAVAMIKASSIIVVVDDENAKFSARNRMAGLVSHVRTGSVNSEVVIDIDGGGALAAIITNESCHGLGLAAGTRAAGIFTSYCVILGVLV